MSISTALNLCERLCVNIGRQAWLAALVVAATGFSATAQTTDAQTTNNAAVTNGPTPVEASQPPAEPAPPRTEAPPSPAASTPSKLDESAFAMIGERNIFNANRSGGQVRLATRRAASVESFTLVGTLAYEKGAFAFFEGSSSEFTKAVKANGVIAGHKLADIFAASVSLEADGKQIELPIGSQMRREDAGAWLVVEEVSSGDTSSRSSRGGDSSRSRRNGDSSSRRSTTTEPAGKAPATAAPSAAEQSEILKRLMERREKE